MQQRRQQPGLLQQRHSQRIFTASEVAEFEYCSLAWWYEQYEPASSEDTEELFARLVELEHEHDAHAPTLPEYQMLEQLLLRRGAFDEGRQQHLAHAEEVAEIEDERAAVPSTGSLTRRLVTIAVVLLVLALVLIALSLLLRR